MLSAKLTHCALVAPYGYKEFDQHWIRLWLATWWQQTITWANVALSSVRSSNIHLRTISKEIPEPSITKISLQISYLKFPSNFPRANGLTMVGLAEVGTDRWVGEYCWVTVESLWHICWGLWVMVASTLPPAFQATSLQDQSHAAGVRTLLECHDPAIHSPVSGLYPGFRF